MYTEEIINRLNNNALHQDDNPGRMVIDGTIGEYLENYDNHLMDLFVSFASGDYLDLHGHELGLVRHEDESDTSFRNRIMTELTIKQSTDDFLKANADLWVFFDDVLVDKNQLTSRNQYLKEEHDMGYVFIGFAELVDKEYLNSKFLLEDILWV